MTNELLFRLMRYLLHFMQASTLVPMAVVWWRRRHFSPPIKLLSWYVYLSAAASLGAEFLYPSYFATNYGFIIGFNLGKTVLFGAVYYQVLALASMRRVVGGLTLAAMFIMAGVVSYNYGLTALSISRVMQCALLAGFALAYLEQTLSRPTIGTTTHDPMWLLSVGQLLYSAGTVTAFSLDLLPVSDFIYNVKFSFVSVSGLVFNYFLTLAFLRAQPNSNLPQEAEAQASTTGKLAGF